MAECALAEVHRCGTSGPEASAIVGLVWCFEHRAKHHLRQHEAQAVRRGTRRKQGASLLPSNVQLWVYEAYLPLSMEGRAWGVGRNLFGLSFGSGFGAPENLPINLFEKGNKAAAPNCHPQIGVVSTCVACIAMVTATSKWCET